MSLPRSGRSMTWQDDCDSPLSRYRASREDDDLNDAIFSVEGVVMKANRTILAMASPILKTLFYGSLAVKMGDTVTIDDGTERGFKAMLEFIYNEGEYSTKDLLGGKEAITEWKDVEKVLELIYFAHKYQINSLVSFGREILLKRIMINTNNVMKIHREIVAFKTTLNSEYSIVNYATKEFIGSQFADIFNDAKVTAEVFLPEDMMVEVLKKKSLGNVTEGFVLQVALDYVRYCQDSEKKAKGKDINPENLAKRIITEVIDFTKLTLDEVDLTEVSAFLPPDVLLKMQTVMITSYKNGLRSSRREDDDMGGRGCWCGRGRGRGRGREYEQEYKIGSRRSVVRTQSSEDCTINLAKTPLHQLPARETSQIKFKVDKGCFIIFNGQHPHHVNNPHGYYNYEPYGHGGYANTYKQIVWKQSGSLKQVVAQQVNSHKFFAEPNAEVTVDFKMHNNSATYALYKVNRKFKKGDIELTVLEVNREPIGEDAKGERAQRGGNKKQDPTSNKGLHVVSFTILPM